MDNERRKRIYTVLVVDDEEIIRWVVRARLEKTGMFTVIEAESGEEAIRFVKITRPDVMIIDYTMPGMDGIMLFATLAASEDISDIPVLFFSSDAAIVREKLQRTGISVPCVGKDRLSEIAGHVKRLLGIDDGG